MQTNEISYKRRKYLVNRQIMLSWLTIGREPSSRLLLPPGVLAAWRARFDKRALRFYNMMAWNPNAVTLTDVFPVTQFIPWRWTFFGNYASHNDSSSSASVTVFWEYQRYVLIRDYEHMRTENSLLWLYQPITIPTLRCNSGSGDRDAALMYRGKIHRCICNQVIGNWLKVVIRNLRFLCEDNEDCITEIVHQLSEWTDTIRALGTLEALLAARFER